MKILYVISDRNIGGAGIQLLNVLRHLDRHAFAVTVALPFRSRLRERLIELETPCEVLTRRSVCELVSVIRSEAPDIVHTNAAIAARVAGRLCGCRVVFTRHCAYPAAANATPLCARIANRLLTDRAIATAAAAARDLLAMGVPSGAITVILNGSDPVREVSADELDRWRSHLHLEPDDFCVGICARLEPCKGHDVFFRAAKIALGRMPQRREAMRNRNRQLPGNTLKIGMRQQRAKTVDHRVGNKAVNIGLHLGDQTNQVCLLQLRSHFGDLRLGKIRQPLGKFGTHLRPRFENFGIIRHDLVPHVNVGVREEQIVEMRGALGGHAKQIAAGVVFRLPAKEDPHAVRRMGKRRAGFLAARDALRAVPAGRAGDPFVPDVIGKPEHPVAERGFLLQERGGGSCVIRAAVGKEIVRVNVVQNVHEDCPFGMRCARHAGKNLQEGAGYPVTRQTPGEGTG